MFNSSIVVLANQSASEPKAIHHRLNLLCGCFQTDPRGLYSLLQLRHLSVECIEPVLSVSVAEENDRERMICTVLAPRVALHWH